MIERSSCGMKLFTANDQIDGYCLPDATMTIIHSINTGINGMDDGGGGLGGDKGGSVSV